MCTCVGTCRTGSLLDARASPRRRTRLKRCAKRAHESSGQVALTTLGAGAGARTEVQEMRRGRTSMHAEPVDDIGAVGYHEYICLQHPRCNRLGHQADGTTADVAVAPRPLLRASTLGQPPGAIAVDAPSKARVATQSSQHQSCAQSNSHVGGLYRPPPRPLRGVSTVQASGYTG